MNRLGFTEFYTRLLLSMMAIIHTTGCTLTASEANLNPLPTSSPIPWTKQLGAIGSSTTLISASTDQSGNILVAGYTDGKLDGNVITGTNDLFVIKYDATGVKQWTKELGVSGESTGASGVVADQTGNIFIAGYTSGNLDGNTRTGSSDFILVKYNASGIKQATKQMGAIDSVSKSNAVAIDQNQNIYLTGYTSGSLDGNTLTGLNDIFIKKWIHP